MDSQLPTQGVAAGSRRLGVIITVLIVFAVAAFGAFYMLRFGTVRTDEMPVEEEVVAVEEAAVEDKVVEEEAGAGAEALTVSIKDFKFVPETITIKIGESVAWKNNEAGVPHSIVLDDGSYKSATVFAGESEARRFPVAGTFPYHCGIHPTMKGVVVVRE